MIGSENTIDLFKDFAALTMISFIDDVSFKLCQDGLFGEACQQKTREIEDIKIKRIHVKKGEVSLHTKIIGCLVIVLYIFWGVVVSEQRNGSFFMKKVRILFHHISFIAKLFASNRVYYHFRMYSLYLSKLKYPKCLSRNNPDFLMRIQEVGDGMYTCNSLLV